MPPYTYHGGRLLNNVQLTSIFARIRFVEPDGTVQVPTWVDSTTTTGQPIAAVCSINSFLRDILSSAYLGLLGTEYSPAGGPKLGFGTLVASTLIELPITKAVNGPPATIQYSDVESMLESSILAGAIPAPAMNSCYMVFFADVGVQDQTGGITGLNAGGFHAVFTTNAGVSVTYCVVDASDVGGSNTTFYASHELIEAITNPNNSGFGIGDGWFDSNDQEIADVCFSADNLHGPPLFHGSSVASFWLPSQNRCGAPANDNLTAQGLTVRLSTVNTNHECALGIPCAEKVKFTAIASVAGVPDPISNPRWFALNGAQIFGPSNQSSCIVQTPNSPGQFGLRFTGIDSFGCTIDKQSNFVCVSPAEMAWLDELCKLRHVVAEYWRFINPLWDPLRDFNYQPVSEAEINRVKQLAAELTRVASLLEHQPKWLREGEAPNAPE